MEGIFKDLNDKLFIFRSIKGKPVATGVISNRAYLHEMVSRFTQLSASKDRVTLFNIFRSYSFLFGLRIFQKILITQLCFMR